MDRTPTPELVPASPPPRGLRILRPLRTRDFALLFAHRLLGRVSSLDWMVSIGLVPVSFALAGPAAEWLGVEATMIGAGLLATITFLAFLAVPGVRDPERSALEPEPEPAAA